MCSTNKFLSMFRSKAFNYSLLAFDSHIFSVPCDSFVLFPKRHQTTLSKLYSIHVWLNID
ncbi:hypothetical protein BpHYR1_049775 [Brachionus plicatilis]|uniref:Uncharacterized protein n=1 Tax=Brachionus plicatilis TaxID=10195 RepID=A0A3M7PHU0_BRAPC|nr:hypothetical protein BpHYR1_049775 [Brachionus plicatilis]